MTASLVFPDNTSEYALQQRQLEARKAAAAKLVQDAMTGTGGSGMAGGVYMVGNQWGNLAKSLGGSLMGAMADRDQQNLAQQQGQAQAEWQQQFDAAPASLEQAGPMPDGTPMPNLPGKTKQQLLSDARNKGLRYELEQQFLKADEDRNFRAEQATQAQLARADERETQREWQAAQDAKFKRTFEESMKLKQAPTIHVSQGGVAQRDRFSVQQGADGKMYRVNLDTGEASPINIQGGAGTLTKPLAADKPLNEAQGNATLFGTRMAEADRVLTEVGTDYSPMKLDIARGAEAVPGGSAAVNAALSPKEQKVAQAQRDFINAVLRKESGAAISPSEFDNARRQYFPQPNDSDAVIEQKRKNRATAISGMKLIAGPGGKHIDATPTQPTAPKPTVAPGTKGMHKGKPVVMGTDGEWHYEN